MARRVVTLEIYDSGARLVALDETFKSAALTDVTTIEFSPDTPEVERLEKIRRAIPGEVDSLILAADARNTSTRVLNFPFDDTAKLRGVVDFELEGLVPYDRNDIAITWEVRGSEQGTSVLTALTPRPALLERIDVLQEANLEPRAVVLPAAVLAELVKPEGEEKIAVICVDSGETHIAIASASGVRFARTVRVGKLVTPGGAQTPVDAVTRAVVTTLRALPWDDAPNQVALCGAFAEMGGLRETLEIKLGIPTTVLKLSDALGDVESQARRLGPEYAVPVAMALGHTRHGDRGIRFDFRRGELAYAGDFQLYKAELTRVGLGLAIVFLVGILTSIVRYALVSGEEAEINQKFCSATKQIVGREICDPMAALATLKQNPNAARGVHIPSYSAASMFELLSRRLPSDLDVTFSTLEFRIENRADEPDRISGKGEAVSFEAAEKVQSVLKADPCVKLAEISRQKKRSDQRIDFNLEVELQCPTGKSLGENLAVASASTETPAAAAPAAPSPSAAPPSPAVPRVTRPPGNPFGGRIPGPAGNRPAPPFMRNLGGQKK